MNLHCVIPKANFDEEKQTLLLAYCALVGRPFPTHLVDSWSELSNVCAFFFFAMTWRIFVWQCGIILFYLFCGVVFNHK